MNTKTFAAQYVFTNEGNPIKNGAVTVNETTGEITEIKTLTQELLLPNFTTAS